jgi:aminoglycoside phosphotransferase (APT) family kinase protein
MCLRFEIGDLSYKLTRPTTRNFISFYAKTSERTSMDCGLTMNSDPASTRPPEPDCSRLAEYLSVTLGLQGSVSMQQFAGGQSNPTYLVRVGNQKLVLRSKPKGDLLPSAHAVDREFRVISALSRTEIPVARTLALCEDPNVIGRTFYLMEYVEGRVFWDPLLPGLDIPQRAAIFDEMNRIIATLHNIEPGSIGLSDYGRSGSYLQRQLARWTKQYKATEAVRIDSMERLIEWLPAHLPEDSGTSLVHGDFRLDNLIFHPNEPRVLAVLDWELSTLGDPLVDFAYNGMSWHIDNSFSGLRGVAGVNLAALGIPDESSYVAQYCERTRRAHPQHWDYYIVYNLFRLAGILQGIAARALQGNAANPSAAEFGSHAKPLAEIAWLKAQQMR